MTWRRICTAGLLAVLGVVVLAAVAAGETGLAADQFEVWALDQADTAEEGGGLLYIWDGHQMAQNARKAAPEVIDLADAAEAAIAAGVEDCRVGIRPHMALANHSDPPTHMIVSNVASGDIYFIEVESRDIVGCVSGAGNAHAANATPNNEMVIVADIAGQSLHKIETDYENNDYTLVESLFLGTPDVLAELGTDTAGPICHEFTADSRFAYVTMVGGGLLVVDVGTADGTAGMEVAHVYSNEVVASIGCGAFRLPDDRMLTNSESGQFGGDDFLYVFDTSGAADGVFPDPVEIELPGDDTHGVDVCMDHRGDLYAWTLMRVSNHLNVVDLQTNEVVRTQSLERPWSPDPKPDIGLIHGGKMFVSLRGPVPLTAIGGLQDPERTPGVAVLGVHQNCQTLSWGAKNLAPMEENPNTVTVDGVEVTASDPHGLWVVPR